MRILDATSTTQPEGLEMKGEQGFVKGQVAWNKGLTKETDPRMAKIAEGTSKARRKLAAQGKLTAWNKGLTKETDERMARGSRKRAESFRRGEWEGWSKGLTKETDERVRIRAERGAATKQKQSEAGEIVIWITGLTKETDPRVAKLSRSQRLAYAEGRRGKPGGGSARKGRREDLGHFVRSSWEANFARLLKFLGREYEYESKRFIFESNGEETSYLPDFYIVDLDRYVEIKGFWRKGHLEKVEHFLRAFPNVQLDIIGKDEYTKLEEKFSSLIPNWEQPQGDSKMKTEEASAVKGLLGDDTVFYTEKGRCFHVLDCPRVSKSRGGVASAKQAIKWGLVPCRVCQPEKNVLMLYTI